MQSEMPFYESPEDALKAAVQALGGAKKVAPLMWPDKSVENARDYFLACLNPDRNEKLSYSQLIFIFREAKAVGFHAGFDWFARECEYEARPITREEEKDRLIAVIEESTKTLSGSLALLERLQNTHARLKSVA